MKERASNYYRSVAGKLTSAAGLGELPDLGSRLARGTFWSVAGTLVSRGLVVVATIFVARILGKEAYGKLGIVRSTVDMLGAFAGFKLGLTANKFIAELRSTDKVRTGRVLSLTILFSLATGALLAVILFMSAPWMAKGILNSPELYRELRIASLIIFVNSVSGAQTGALAGFEAFRTIATINFFIGFLSFPLLIAGALSGGIGGVMWALLVLYAFQNVMNHCGLVRQMKRFGIRAGWRGVRNEVDVLFSYSLPATLSGILLNPVNWICSAILVNQPGGYGEMGILNAATQWYGLMLFLPNMIGTVLLPILSERLGKQEGDHTVHLVKTSMRVNLMVVVPLVVLLSLFSPLIMSFYGPSFVSGWPTLVVVLLTAILLCLQTPIAQFIAASGRMWLELLMNLTWAAVFLLGTVFLVKIGSVGLVAARGVAYLILLVWSLAFFRISSRRIANTRLERDAVLP